MAQPMTQGGSGVSKNTNGYLATGLNQAMAYAKKLVTSLTQDNIPATNTWGKISASLVDSKGQLTGATGTFTSGGHTLTIVNGLITDIT